MKRRYVLVLGFGATLASTMWATAPVASQGSGGVAATVTVGGGGGGGGACITVGTSSVDFGTMPFSTPTTPAVKVSDNYGLTNCGGAPATFLGRSTNATSPTATWTLSEPTTSLNPCDDAGTNRYYDGIETQEVYGLFSTVDGDFTTPMFGGPVPPAGGVLLANLLAMPCQGSTGLGQTMAFSFTYTAVVAAP